MSYFEMIIYSLLAIYLIGGLAMFLFGTRQKEESSGKCFVVRRSSRRVVAKGEPFEVDLFVRGEGGVVENADPTRTVLVVDRSDSMLSESTRGTPLHTAVQAVVAFARQLDRGRGRGQQNQIAVVQFDDTAETLCDLTSSWLLVEAASRRIERGGGTDALTGMEEAAALLARPATNPNTRDTVVLLTDGETSRKEELERFCRSRIDGSQYRVVTVGLGPDADEELLRNIASPRDGLDITSADDTTEFYKVEDVADLVDLFRSLAHHIQDSAIGSGTLKETVTRGIFQYTDFDDRHRPTNDRTATTSARWILPVIETAPRAVRYQITGRRVGWHRIAGEEAGFDFYCQPGPVHHKFQKGLPQPGEDPTAREVHDKRCWSERAPRVLITPRFGLPVIWAIFLNPLFWIVYSQFNSLFRKLRPSRVTNNGPEVTPPQSVAPALQTEGFRLPPPVQPPSFRPTLVIGGGKSGRHVLSAYKAMIADANGGEFPKDDIKLLQIDTDVRSDVNNYDFAGTKLLPEDKKNDKDVVIEEGEIADLATDIFDLHQVVLSGGERALHWYLASRMAGLPREVFNTGGGVHRVRQIARLALFKHLREPDSTVRLRLRSAVEFLEENLTNGRAAQVMIVCSGTGGTGSGIVHDLAYLIKRSLYRRMPKGHEHAPVNVFFLGTKCFSPRLHDGKTYEENSRALLTEIDRLLTNSDLPIGIDYGVTLGDIFQDGKSGDADMAGSVYDQVYVIDPAPDIYRDEAGADAASSAETSHYPALADLLTHYSVANNEFQEYLAKEILNTNASRILVAQRGHVCNVNLRSIRFPVKLMTEWLGWRFVRDWFTGRTLWVRSEGDGFASVEVETDGPQPVERLLNHQRSAKSPPFLFDRLEALAQDMLSSWDSVWTGAFRALRATDGHDRASEFVAQQTRMAFLTLLDWIQFSLNGSGGNAANDLDGALPRTLDGLLQLRELVERAILNLGRLPVDTLSDVGAEAFPQWKANILQDVLDSYHGMVVSCVKSLDRWHKCLLGTSEENESQNEVGVCRRINERLRTCAGNLDTLSDLHSVRFKSDRTLRKELFKECLEDYLDDDTMRSRLAWRLDFEVLTQLDERLKAGNAAAGVDRLLARILRLIVRVDEQGTAKEFTDPLRQADEICHTLSDVANQLHNIDAYCQFFMERNPAGPPFDRSLVQPANAVGGDDPIHRQVVVNSAGFGDAQQGDLATTQSIYEMPFVRAEMEFEVGIRVDQSVSWNSDSRPDEANYVFMEEQFSTVLRKLVAEQLFERYEDFSPRLRHYFNHFDRLQEFLHLCLGGDIRETMSPGAGQNLLAWHHNGETYFLSRNGVDLLEAMNVFVGREARDVQEPRSRLVIDRPAFCQAIANQRWNDVPGWAQLPLQIQNELVLVLRLVEKAGGYLDLRF